MNKFFVTLVSVLCLGFTQAQVFSSGGCPNVQSQKNFDLNRYLGDWYEVYKFYASFEGDQTCARAHYEMKPNGHILIVNSGLQDGKNISARGDAFVPDPVNEPAKLKLRFSPFAPYGNYWVLDTDYDNYTFIYSCSAIVGVTHYEFAWILSRHKNVTDVEKQKLFNEAKAFGINTDNFKLQNQAGCPDISPVQS